MLSFYPGPSKVYPESLGYIAEAYQSGVLSINHRSPAFEALMQDTLDRLHKQWQIPQDYRLYFVSSATEAWEITLYSLVKAQSLHAHSGAFGKKWAFYAQHWSPKAHAFAFDVQHALKDQWNGLPSAAGQADLWCLVHSETSNGSLCSIQHSDLPMAPEALLAVDATSSLGGMQLPWEQADVWLASVQKCLGLPAGLGLMICSPKALERAQALGRRDRYNSLLLLDENHQKFQTHYTPNVLGIYLLNRMQHQLPSLDKVHEETLKKQQHWRDFWQGMDLPFAYLVEDAALQLPTVLALKAEAPWVEGLLTYAQQQGITLGKGYGPWQGNTLRIANFPQHTWDDIEQLQTIIQQYRHEI